MISSKASSGCIFWLRAAMFSIVAMIGCSCFSGSLNCWWNFTICSIAAICSFGRRALLKAAINSSACDTPSPRSWIGSVFFAGMEKAPVALSNFFVDSHQRFHSGSVKTSPTSHSPICAAAAAPPRLSMILRTTATGSSAASFLIDDRSLALRTRKCSGASGVRFSAAYWTCMACDFLPAKSITI